jgi:HEPN domain-containing protein
MLAAADGAAAGLFLQQAIEKFLKGYLVERGWQLRRTHELDRLLDATITYEPVLARFRPLCERVSGYYLVEPYPGFGTEGPDTSQVESDQVETRDLIEALFPDETLPRK